MLGADASHFTNFACQKLTTNALNNPALVSTFPLHIRLPFRPSPLPHRPPSHFQIQIQQK